MSDMDGRSAQARVTVGRGGRITLPAAIRRTAGIQEGTRIHLRALVDVEPRVESAEDIRRRLKFCLPAGTDLAADDRAEADEVLDRIVLRRRLPGNSEQAIEAIRNLRELA